MTTNVRRNSADALDFLENITGGVLTFGKLLGAIRQGEGVSQVEFAKQLQMSKSHLCDIERGRKTVSPLKANEYAQMLGYPEAQFVELALQDLVNKLPRNYRVRVQVVPKRRAA